MIKQSLPFLRIEFRLIKRRDKFAACFIAGPPLFVMAAAFLFLML
jgi:hypothetical protein